QNESLESPGLALRRHHSNHAAHGVADEDDIAKVESVTDVEHIVGVPLYAGVFLGVIGAEIGMARTDVIEQNDFVVIRERGYHESPHVLVAAKPMRQKHRLSAVADDVHVVSF